MFFQPIFPHKPINSKLFQRFFQYPYSCEGRNVKQCNKLRVTTLQYTVNGVASDTTKYSKVVQYGALVWLWFVYIVS